MGFADRDVAELAEVTEGDLTETVDLVATDAVVDGFGVRDGLRLDLGVEDRHGRLPIERTMGSVIVVVVEEDTELRLQFLEGGRGWLLLEEAFEGLVEALDLTAGLRVIGSGVLEDDAQALEL